MTLLFKNKQLSLYEGSALDVLTTLPSESIHMSVTSPPYWGLRDYGVDPSVWGGDLECEHEWDDIHVCVICGAWFGALGLEPTPEMYVEHLVKIFRELRRVLRNDGTLWLNLGDSYSSGGRKTQIAPTLRRKGYDEASGKQNYLNNFAVRPGTPENCKPKDLVGIPWMVAFALRADGWYLRQDIIWHKRNPMPESVRDRCTKAHEYLFLLSKSDHYYYDADAIKEPVTRYANDKIGNESFKDVQETRNKRSVWTISNKPYRGAHFATFPPDLIIPCIMAGSSEKGCCSRCGSPWKRVISRSKMEIKRSDRKDKLGKFGRTAASGTMIKPAKSKTLSWEPSCNCDADVVPCKVLDPFIGSGTTAETSLKLGRNIIGIDINKEYLETHVLSRCSSFI